MKKPPFRRGVFLLIDGARADVFERLLQAGELPHLKRHVYDPGSYLTAVSAFPSTTGPAHLPFLTGCTPGTCNIPGIRWFDRGRSARPAPFGQCRSYVGPGSLFMDTDLRKEIRTVFEFFERPAGVFSVVNRGVSAHRRRTVMAKWGAWLYGHYTGDWQSVDEVTWRIVDQAVEREADFIFALFPAVDELAHLTDPFSNAVLKAYRAIYRSFGRLVEHLARRRLLEETLFVVSSDHGLTATHTHFEVFDFLDHRGHKTLYYPKIWKRNASAISMISGNAMANVYLKNVHGWHAPQPADADLIAACLEQKAVDLAIAKNMDGFIRVHSRHGMAEIRDDGADIYYRVWGRDPFGYGPMPVRMKADQSLALTCGATYPDAPFQVERLFRSCRAGDLVLSARKGYDFRRLFEHPEHHASHGSLHREHMLVPLLLNYPVQRTPVRTVDVFPSMLELLGRAAPENIDGRSFVRDEMETEGQPHHTDTDPGMLAAARRIS